MFPTGVHISETASSQTLETLVHRSSLAVEHDRYLLVDA